MFEMVGFGARLLGTESQLHHFISYVTLGKSFNVCVAQFFYLKMRLIILTLPHRVNRSECSQQPYAPRTLPT